MNLFATLENCSRYTENNLCVSEIRTRGLAGNLVLDGEPLSYASALQMIENFKSRSKNVN